MKKFENIKNFLLDAKAISPAIATLILIVIAAVAAAGIGIIVQNAQTKTQGQVGTQDLSVSGTIDIKGSTTVLPITVDEIKAFNKKYPAVTINTGGGGSGTGRALVYNKQVDIGASSDIWPTGDNNIDQTTGLAYPGRATAIIQAAGMNAFVNEQKIGTSMVVVAANIPGITNITIVNSGTTNVASNPATIVYSDLVNLYVNNAGPLATAGLKPVRRSDDSGTQEVFAKWLNAADPTTKQFNSTVVANTNVYPAQGNEGIRDYIANNQNTIGFVDVAFSDNYAGSMTTQAVKPQGNNKVIAAYQNGIAALNANRGIPVGSGTLGSYNNNSKIVNGAGATGTNGLARDLYYYSQPGTPTGAVQAFENYVMSNDGQTILTNDGFFTPT